LKVRAFPGETVDLIFFCLDGLLSVFMCWGC
jgi:hypothetical protein